MTRDSVEDGMRMENKTEDREKQLLRDLGARIVEARKRKSISQSELANRVGISAAHLSAIELGKTHFSILIFSRIAETLQISADALLQLDTPALTQIKAYELEELFLDCSVEEKKAILDMAAETKKILRKFEGGLEKA